jgi:murein biosynthesis integral membrane protein MurJ
MTLANAPGIARAAATVAVVTIAARVVGFGRILVFAHTVGPSCLGDTYYTANTVPNILFDIVAGGALTSIVVPVLAGPAHAGDAETADRTASALLTWTLLLLTPVFIFGVLAARPIMNLLVGNGHPGCPAADEQAVGARMLVVFMPQVLLYGAAIVLTGVLQAHRRFLAPALAPLISSVIVIAAYLSFASTATSRETSLSTLTRTHELILSIGTTAGVVGLLLPLLFPIARTGRRLRPTLHFPPGVASTARRLAVAGAIVLGSQDLATAAILRLANDRGASGAVVLFNLAWTVFLLPWAVLAVPVATAAFPTLVAQWQADTMDSYAATAAAGARMVLLGCAAAAAVLVACARPAARVIVLGAPGDVAPAELARALVTFAPGLLGFGLVAVLSRVHYARSDARTPAVATAVGWAVTVGADVALVVAFPRSWTAAALGLGTSIGMTLAAVLMLIALRRTVHTTLRGFRTTVAAASAAGVLAAAAGRLASVALPAGGVAVSVAVTVIAALCSLAIFAPIAHRVDPATTGLLLRRVRRAA